MPDIYEELHDCAGGEEPLTQIERKELAASINRFLEGLDRESGLFSCADTGIWMASERLPGGLRSARVR